MKSFKEFLNEGTFNSDSEIAIYDSEEGLTYIEKRKDGTYYGYNDEFDFDAKDLDELKMKLNKWGYRCIAGELI